MTFRAYVAAFVAICCWGSLAVATQASLREIPPKVVMFWSFAWSAVFLGAYSVRGGEWLRDIRATTAPKLLIGLLGTFGSYYCYFQAMSLAPILEANLLNYTWPIQLVLWSAVFLSQPMHWRICMAMFFAAAGAFILIGKGDWPQLSPSHSLGYVFAIFSGLFWSLFSVLLRWKDTYAPSLFVSSCAATIASLLTTFHDPMFLQLGAGGIALTAYIGVVTMGIGYVAWKYAVKEGNIQVLSALSYLIPVISTFLLVLVGRNSLSGSAIAGAGLVVAGATLADRSRKVDPVPMEESKPDAAEPGDLSEQQG